MIRDPTATKEQKREAVSKAERTLETIILDSNGQPRFDIYDIRKRKGDDYGFVVHFMNRAEVKESLGVSDRTWAICNDQVHEALARDDIYQDASVHVAWLLEKGLQVHFYTGEQDFVCNWEGGLAWAN